MDQRLEGMTSLALACRYCGAEVQADALRCHFCGTSYPTSELRAYILSPSAFAFVTLLVALLVTLWFW